MLKILNFSQNYDKTKFIDAKRINIQTELDLFLIVKSSDKSNLEILSNKIIDNILGRINSENYYKAFSPILENLNFIIKTLDANDLDVLVAISNKNSVIFSTIGKVEAISIKSNGEVSEITDRGEPSKEFSYILSGELDATDKIIFSSSRITNKITKTDLYEAASKEDLNEAKTDLESLISDEFSLETIAVFILGADPEKLQNFLKEEPSYKKALQNFTEKFKGNESLKNFTEKVKEKTSVLAQQKVFRNIVIGLAVLISVFGIVAAVKGVLNGGSAPSTKVIEQTQTEITEVTALIRTLGTKLSLPDEFNSLVTEIEPRLASLKASGVFPEDVAELENTVNSLKKTISGINVFTESEGSLVYQSSLGNSDKSFLVSNSGKNYIVDGNSITGPIVAGSEAKNLLFMGVDSGEYFTNAVPMGDNIILSTNLGKVVIFTKAEQFSVANNASGSWPKIDDLGTFGTNRIYVLDKEQNQIFTYTYANNTFGQPRSYLNAADASGAIGKIESMAIDGGFYFLLSNGAVSKFYSSPYRVESLLVNGLPDNYKNADFSNAKIFATANLSYVYVYLDSKIFILRPNTTNVMDTKNLTYIGQIEGANDIKGFSVLEDGNDGKIYVLTETGLHVMSFTISDNRIVNVR